MRVAPPAAELGPRGQRRLRFIIRMAVNRLSGMQRFQIRLLVFVIQYAPLLLFLRRFDRLPPRRQDQILRFLENAPLRLLRSGIWGLKTLLFMGYYGQKNVGRQINYRPSFHGNDKLTGTDG